MLCVMITHSDFYCSNLMKCIPRVTLVLLTGCRPIFIKSLWIPGNLNINQIWTEPSPPVCFVIIFYIRCFNLNSPHQQPHTNTGKCFYKKSSLLELKTLFFAAIQEGEIFLIKKNCKNTSNPEERNVIFLTLYPRVVCSEWGPGS